MGSHGFFLQLQGGEAGTVEALRRGDVEAAGLNTAENALMNFVALVTQHAYQTTADDVQKLRDVRWTDEQIAEAVYITALFAFFNRVADAFGLEDPQYIEKFGQSAPPDLPGRQP